MTLDEFAQVKKRLEGAYRTTMTPAQADAYWDLWGRLPLTAIANALDGYIRDDHHGRFPAAPPIVVLADRAWQDELAKQKQREVKTLREAAQLVFHGSPDEPVLARDGGIGAYACQLIRDLCDDKITQAEYTARRAAMDRRWP